MFTSQFTHVAGHFFLDNQDSAGPCGSSSYARTADKATPTDPACMWNVQPLRQRSFSNYTSRGLSGGTYDTYSARRPLDRRECNRDVRTCVARLGSLP